MPWLFQEARHGPIWLDPNLLNLWEAGSLEKATFTQCMFGAPYPKYTTLWFSVGLAQQLQGLRRLLCTHAPGTHGSAAGGVQRADGTWNSADAAAYPADFNLFVAEAILARIVARETPGLDEPLAPAEPLEIPTPTAVTAVAETLAPAPAAQPPAELPPPATADGAEPPSPPDTPPAGSPDPKARKKAPRLPAWARRHPAPIKGTRLPRPQEVRARRPKRARRRHAT